MMPAVVGTETAPSRTIATSGVTGSYPRKVYVPELVAQQAADTPDAIAIDDGVETLTYASLNAHADRLAARLRGLGVGIDVPVAILLPRSAGMVVAALGIMKAGGAYVPIDPSYPDARVAAVLRDAQPPVVVTDERGAARLPASDCHVITVDAIANRGIEDDTLETVPLAPSHLAYIIYTSGSTGSPKGVAITHGGLLNLVLWHRAAFSIVRTDRATQHASPGFDAAVWELWPYLSAGASVHAMDEATRLDPERLRDWIVAERITVSFLPTPLAERVMALDWPAQSRLRLLLTGADTLHVYPSAKLPFPVVNNYGPTECTVVATSGVVRAGDGAERLPTIGQPIANTQIHILDEQMRPVPVGTPGEIYIGGAGVARGYLNRPDLTAQKFVSDPFRTEPDARLYRTGDLGRYLVDGRIAFLGRIDGQVKIRGYRIETDEIAAVIKQHPAVAACVVVAREDPCGERRLVAYVVPRVGGELTHRQLVATLAAALPDYMIPAEFVQLAALPLMPSGKVDLAGLPAPTETNTLRERTVVAPRTPIEARLATILAELLSLERVGVSENLFLLGSHSLLGAQVLARVRDAFGVSLSLRTLFAGPTIEALAAEIERALPARAA
ncbi:MAG TPA: non-ribosomal peptide synthetase [Candidatus Acidoferrum sp.]|nr:non-ribosomal peptide synthetase [Candidatus Acidoferrum sp.]